MAQPFQRPLAANSDSPRLTISRDGTLGLNRPGMDALGAPSHVRLLHDDTRNLIGLQPSWPDDANAYRLNPRNRSVSGKRFLQSAGIDYEAGAVRYVAKLVDNVLWVDLNVSGIDVTSNRSPRA